VSVSWPGVRQRRFLGHPPLQAKLQEQRPPSAGLWRATYLRGSKKLRRDLLTQLFVWKGLRFVGLAANGIYSRVGRCALRGKPERPLLLSRRWALNYGDSSKLAIARFSSSLVPPIIARRERPAATKAPRCFSRGFPPSRCKPSTGPGPISFRRDIVRGAGFQPAYRPAG